jgi:endonuclease/exonuclease/phosphatase family metal-dependent hydrolase
MMKRRHALFLFLFSFLLVSCRAISNYEDASGPMFSGNYASTPGAFDGILKVISWNIKFSEEIPEALEDFAERAELADADIILLQEMDEEGVEVLSRALHYNYVYFPASIHTHHNRNFGNAILARWPIHDPGKLLLPHRNPKNKQTRIAAKAVIAVEDMEVLTYSVHTETFWLPPARRADQIQTLIGDVDSDSRHVIVGGDFNTLTPVSVAAVVERFEQAGFQWATAGVGGTVESVPIPLTMDFIFTKGMTVLNAGSVEGVDASDHRPVWTTLTFN